MCSKICPLPEKQMDFHIFYDRSARELEFFAAAAAKSLQSCPTLCDPIDGRSPGSPIPGILWARILEWVAISFPNAWKWKVKVKSESEVTQSCPTFSDPMDCSPPGSSVHWIFQAKVLGWGAIAFPKSFCGLYNIHIWIFVKTWYGVNLFCRHPFRLEVKLVWCKIGCVQQKNTETQL